jgi:hypothetical protein
MEIIKNIFGRECMPQYELIRDCKSNKNYILEEDFDENSNVMNDLINDTE